jgi:hypothetical protein
VYCPRCGTPNEPGDRFCSSCGATLGKAAAPKERTSPREWLGQLFGTTRKARLISAATAIALAAALIAFIALKPSEDSIPRDAYTIAADRQCLGAKREIVTVQRRSRDSSGTGETSALAQELVQIVATWRSQLEKLSAPRDRIASAQALEAALLEAEIRIAQLARVARRGDEKQTVESAERADLASTGVEEAVASLGLSHCAEATIGLAASSG